MEATKLVITSVTKDSPGAGQFTVVGTYTAAQTFNQPPQLVTIFAPPAAKPTFLRAVRVTSDGVFLLRNGATNVALDIASWAKLAFGIEGSLTHAPTIATHPSNDSCVASSTAADFTVAADSSESTLSYQWQYETKASGTIVTSGTELADGDTVTINGQAYRFKDTMAQAYDVKRHGTTAATTLENLIKAINGTGTPGTEYFAGTSAHPTVQADTSLTVSSTTLTLRARSSGTAGNALTLAKSSTQLTVSGATLSGGGSWSSATGTVLDCAYTNGTTVTLTATPTSTRQSGTNHRCVVTNANSSVNSNSALLTIT